jgi:hypothetical protein
MAVGSNLAEHLDEDLNKLGIDDCEVSLALVDDDIRRGQILYNYYRCNKV